MIAPLEFTGWEPLENHYLIVGQKFSAITINLVFIILYIPQINSNLYFNWN